MHMKTNKSQGLSINTIIIAAIALVVLVVMIAIFTGKLGNINKNLDSCAAKGGVCATNSKDGCPSDHPISMIIGGTECKNSNNLCCMKVSQ